MNAQPLYLADGREAEAAYCGECRVIHRRVANAESCCAPRSCDDCGTDLARGYVSTCGACQSQRVREREARRFAAANKLHIEDFRGHSCT